MIYVVKPPRKYSVCRRNNNLHQMERVQDTADRGPTKRCSTVAVAASSFSTARDARNCGIKLVVLTNCVIQKGDLLPLPLNLSLYVVCSNISTGALANKSLRAAAPSQGRL
jgi:hypothetical protein